MLSRTRVRGRRPARAPEPSSSVIEVPGGGSVTTLVNATPIRSEEGEVVSVVVTLQDMTPLEEMERLRAEFLGMVSHELRTPLTSIKGSAATLMETASDLDPAEMLQFFRIIGEQADYMRDLIGDLLDVARIETGELSVAPAPSEMATLADEARSRFQSGGGRSNLRIDLSPELPLVMADGRRIIQVLNNLLTNAARYSHEASAIGVSAVREGYHVAVTVTDEGRGDRRRAAAAPISEVLPHRRRGPETGHRGVGAGPRHLQGDSGGPRGPDLGRERRAWPGGAVHLHDSSGRGCRSRRSPALRPPGATGAGAHPRGGRRPADAQARPGRARQGGLRADCDRRPAGGAHPPSGVAPPQEPVQVVVVSVGQ